MDPTDDYRTLNQASWDERAPAHAASPGYHLAAFRSDPAYLSDVVTFDLPLLGDVSGLRGVHLQCHIGTDTISLARLGARMTGLDFSPAAVAQATALSEELGAGVDFVEADVYDAAEVLPQGEFDLVFTGIGALNWLPSVSRWAEVVAEAAQAGRSAVHPGGASGALGAGRPAARRPARARVPLLSSARSRWSGTRAAPTSRPTSSSSTTRPRSGTTASVRS